MAALFALLTPLCALACLDEGMPEPSVSASAPLPCHQESTPRPEAPSSREACCDSASLEAAAIDGTGFSADPTHHPSAWGPLAIQRPAQRPVPLPREAQLPAPDILTLHATLLL
jgi:hypothetical protein